MSEADNWQVSYSIRLNGRGKGSLDYICGDCCRTIGEGCNCREK